MDGVINGVIGCVWLLVLDGGGYWWNEIKKFLG